MLLIYMQIHVILVKVFKDVFKYYKQQLSLMYYLLIFVISNTMYYEKPLWVTAHPK